jgi:sialate O-acetylesterase
MVAPLLPLSVKGAIWYQGESNVSRAQQYRTLFPAMIRNWRADFNQPDLPFYFVQIAPYRYNNPLACAELWEAQLHTLKTVQNTGMVVTTDIGNFTNIHPTNKQDVGLRLASWALTKDYGKKGISYSGPVYQSAKVEAGKVRLSFEHAAGLKARDGKSLTHFSIAGEDQKFVPAEATVDGEFILVHAADVPKPVAVRFGWDESAEPNLVNASGLPASPFRTDNFPAVTADKN